MNDIHEDLQALLQELHVHQLELERKNEELRHTQRELEIAQQILQESEARNRAILKALPDLIFVCDKNGTYLDYYAKNPNDFLGKTIDETLPSKVAQPLMHGIAQAYQTGEIQSFEYQLSIGNKLYCYEARIVVSETNEALIIARDITVRKQAEKALIKSQQRYEKLVHSIEGVVWQAEANSRKFTFISKQAERFFGYPLENWLNQATFCSDHIHPDDQAWVIAICEECVDQKTDHDFEYRMITADNRTIWIRNLVNVVVENDQVVKLYGVMLDISKRKQTEEELKKKNEELGIFNRLAINRELKMVELKKEINELLAESCQEPRYKIPH